MVDVFGNEIIGAYTNGVAVQAIYANGVLVWPTTPPPPSGPYYINWLPTNVSTGFHIDGVSYQTGDYEGSFTWDGGVITSSAFDATYTGQAGASSISSIKTNAYRINNKAFYGCYSLKSISLPDCQYIGDSVFQGCSFYFTDVDLPKCSYIGSYAFNNCGLYFLSLPKCEYIGNYAFQSCSRLLIRNWNASYTLPQCKYIGSYAFNGCSTKLSQIKLPKCSYLDNGAFQSCYNLSSVSLPKCEYIGNKAFDSCSSLKSISLPVCSYIGKYAFDGCSSLSSVSLPKCEYIGNGGFANCTSLSSISLPKCEYIGDLAFMSCYSLRWDLSLPVCSYIGSGAFALCSIDIIRLGYSGVCTLVSSNAFLGTRITSSTGVIYVAGNVNSYKTAPGWSYFKDRIVHY